MKKKMKVGIEEEDDGKNKRGGMVWGWDGYGSNRDEIARRLVLFFFFSRWGSRLIEVRMSHFRPQFSTN
jgi:hypothetical protein